MFVIHRYLAICLGGLQSVVKTLVEGHVEACGWNIDVQLFREDVKGRLAIPRSTFNYSTTWIMRMCLTDRSGSRASGREGDLGYV